MVISQSTYDNGRLYELSFFSLENSTSPKCAEILVYNCVQFVKESYLERMRNLSPFIKDKQIYIDSTYELFSEKIVSFLDAAFENLKNFHYFFIPSKMQENCLSLKNCIDKGLQIYPAQYFADYPDKYIPIISNDFDKVEKKKFLFYTGKVSKERTLLVSLLSYFDLIKYGYVSYFGNKNIDSNFDTQKEEDVFFLNLTKKQKKIIQEGFEKLTLPLTVDVKKFNKDIAHAREYNADYYNAVDFCVISETDHYKGMFITEKTVKCIQQNKKFIAFAGHNYINDLKLYYREKHKQDISHLTDWCDTSYDKCKDTFDRAKKIVEIIKEEIEK
ncbi:MAG: hypothetical protein CBD88_04535 [Flavobacteriales bacterium TMED228]|nr:MAG: hypothetical protein CBD88_04535 [Flavobacteriales bacterium TMED228]|tara:strand:- start:443 stop:1432 length:990 start_codon:yes stop_codon:yes gene_type:complete